MIVEGLNATASSSIASFMVEGTTARFLCFDLGEIPISFPAPERHPQRLKLSVDPSPTPPPRRGLGRSPTTAPPRPHLRPPVYSLLKFVLISESRIVRAVLRTVDEAKALTRTCERAVSTPGADVRSSQRASEGRDLRGGFFFSFFSFARFWQFLTNFFSR